ncbi:MAG: AAA family ATPase [Candidatus Thiodiazotropha lotti]
MAKRAEVRQLHIKGFRGIENLKWNPHKGMNIILGGGDCGKSTILEALGLLFSSSGNRSLTESDFWNKKSEDGFYIEAAMYVSDDFEFSAGTKIYWPWEWDGENPVLPAAEADEVPEAQSPVFKVAVSATGDYELSWEIIQPDGSREHFPVGLRRKIGLVALTNDDRNDRDLRLVYGSALDRLITDNSLRSKIGHAISQVPLKGSLSDDAKQALEKLDGSLQKEHLPSGLDLGVTSSQGVSIGSLIGLLANKGDISLPLATWGSGTRRMATLLISAAKDSETQITTIDELERGLEPYRLRQLVLSLLKSDSQSFVTTHSPIAISCSEGAQLWYVDAAGNLGMLDQDMTATHQRRDPETFLSRVSVIAEGETEVGFIIAILETIFGGNPLDAGVRVSLGQGDDQLLDLLESLNKSGITFAGFADNDGKKPERWTQLKTAMEARLFQWENGCIETNILSLLPDEYLENLFKDQDGDWDGYRLRNIATRLGIEGKSFEEIRAAADEQGQHLRDLIVAAATGDNSGVDDRSEKKSWKKHAQNWFKKADGSGGRELLHHLIQSNKWEALEETLRPFFNSVLTLSEKSVVEKIDI